MASGKITALEVQKRDRERVSVYIDNQFAFGLNMLDASHLQVGQVLADAEITSLQAKDRASQAMNAAVRFLAPRPRSREEIRRKLEQKKFENAIIAEVIDRLEELLYLDDYEFARYWVDNRNQFNPRGTHALRYELRQKGIENAVIDEVLTSLDSVTLARQAAQKKLRSLKGKDAKTVRTRLSGFLSRRGFDYDAVRTVVNEVLENVTDDDYEE